MPGHWEGDLILGTASAIGTLVERIPVRDAGEPPGRRDSEEVSEALTGTISGLPAGLRRSLTWDRGMEMAPHDSSPSTRTRCLLL